MPTKVFPTVHDVGGGGGGRVISEKSLSRFAARLLPPLHAYVCDLGAGFGGFLVTAGAGLEAVMAAGEAVIAGYRVVVEGPTSLALAPNDTQFVVFGLQRDDTGYVTGATATVESDPVPDAFAEGEYLTLATITTDGTGVVALLDTRPLGPLVSFPYPDLLDFGDGGEGDFLSDGPVTLGGEHLYDTVDLRAGHTLTIDAADGFLILRARKAIRIAGTVDGKGKGAAPGGGGIGGPKPASPGTGGASGGSGGGAEARTSGQGGDSRVEPHALTRFGLAAVGATLATGGAPRTGVGSGNPGATPAVDLRRLVYRHLATLKGAAGGDGAGDKDTLDISISGGRGGAGLWLIAPVIEVLETATIDLRGNNGNSGGGLFAGGGAGAGAGACVGAARHVRAWLATFLLAGGVGGTGPGGAGGKGGDGWQAQVTLP